MIIDATDLKVGRIATEAAKAALKGENVEIVNVEKAILTGNKKDVIAKYQQRYERRGPHWGPNQPRMPDRFVRRIIRGMLPTNTARGREAYKRVMCYIGNPEDKKAETITEAHISNSQTLRYITVHELCSVLGGRV